MKKFYFIIALSVVSSYLLSINKYDVLAQINSISNDIAGITVTGYTKNILNASNNSLDNFYELISMTKSFINETKTKTQAVKSFFGKEDPAIAIMNSLESYIIDFINAIKITRGIKSSAGFIQQSNQFNTIITKINSLETRLASLPKEDVQSVLTALINFIKNIVTKAKLETDTKAKSV